MEIDPALVFLVVTKHPGEHGFSVGYPHRRNDMWPSQAYDEIRELISHQGRLRYR